MEYPRYESYKDSGITWLGSIPSHWKISKLKYLGQSIIGITYAPEDVVDKSENGILVLRASNIQNNRLSFKDCVYINMIVPKKLKTQFGDVLICSRNGSRNLIGKNALISEKVVGETFGAFMTIYRSSYWKYLSKVFQSEIFTSQSDLYLTTTINQLTIATLNNLVVPLPLDEFEQQSIANFLDKETSRLDALIAKKQQLIETLKEKRIAIISHAVTKGLNPDIPMKDSGIEWLGVVPVHWEVKKLKYVFKGFESGVSVNSINTPALDEEIGVLKTSCVYDYTFRPSENKVVLQDDLDRVSCQVKANSIIMSRMNTPDLVGASGYVEKDYKNLFLPDRLWQTVLWPHIELHVKWLSYIFITKGFRSLISSLATGTSPSMKNITQGNVLNIKVGVPDYKEQETISNYLDSEFQKIEKIIGLTEKHIDKLMEYKTALISAAVTGKIKVPEQA